MLLAIAIASSSGPQVEKSPMKSMTSHESQEISHEKLNVLLKGLGMMLLGLSLTTCPAYQNMTFPYISNTYLAEDRVEFYANE